MHERDAVLVELFGDAPPELLPGKMRQRRTHAVVVVDGASTARHGKPGEMRRVGATRVREPLLRSARELTQRPLDAVAALPGMSARDLEVRQQRGAAALLGR